MSEQVNVPGMPEKKGMSKGCLVALIVVGVLLVMIIAAVAVCYWKKDELLKAGTNAMINSIKTELQSNPVEGADAERFNRVADAFMARMDSTDIDLQKYGAFAQEVQAVMQDKVIEPEEVEDMIQSMVQYFPELESIAVPDEMPEAVIDSTMVDSMVPEEQ